MAYVFNLQPHFTPLGGYFNSRCLRTFTLTGVREYQRCCRLSIYYPPVQPICSRRTTTLLLWYYTRHVQKWVWHCPSEMIEFSSEELSVLNNLHYVDDGIPVPAGYFVIRTLQRLIASVYFPPRGKHRRWQATSEASGEGRGSIQWFADIELEMERQIRCCVIRTCSARHCRPGNRFRQLEAMTC